MDVWASEAVEMESLSVATLLARSKATPAIEALSRVTFETRLDAMPATDDSFLSICAWIFEVAPAT